jgi:hypothetical protein
MQINDLKIGDYVRFISSDKGHINTGFILNQDNEEWWISENSDILLAGKAQNWSVKPKNILFKLESPYLMYKEIPIKQPTNLIKISDLKIGDRIKGKISNGDIYEGIITSFNSGNQITLDDGHWLYKSQVICKLELVSYHSNYKEIPIEKENDKKCICCGREWENKEKYGQNFWNMYTPTKCCEPGTFNSKPAPIKNISVKSFKFDFHTRDTDGHSLQPFYNKEDGKFMYGFTECNGKAFGSIKMPVPHWAELNKIYTIEIKEKE